ncbi:DNA polymerase [Streptomyces roseifaciens]
MKQLVTTPDELSEIVGYFSERDAFAFDVETTGPSREVAAVNQVVWITLATQGHTAVIPMGHPNGYRLLRKASRRKNKKTGTWEHLPVLFDEPPKQLRPSQVFDALEPLFFSDRLKIGHNLPFDLLSIAKYYGGRYAPPPYGDTIVGAWMLDENRLLGLKKLVLARYGLDYDKDDVGKCIERHTFGDVADYTWMDGRNTWLLWRTYAPLIEAEGLMDVWELEMDVLHCLLHMQSAGAPVDITALERLREQLRREIGVAEAEVYRAAGKIFNISSVKQKQAVLYDSTEQGLTPRKRTKTGAPSTDADALAAYRGKNTVVDAILAYQELDKIHSTYVEGYLGNEEKPSRIFNGKIYPSYRQYGTVTGRLSCSDPNVQNWPRSATRWGTELRNIILPPDDYLLLVADYSQIEQRLAAHFAGPGALWQGFWDGIDAHTATAALVFGVPPEGVTKDMRQVAKAIAFAINYGAGPEKVASMCSTSVTRAKKILATHEREFPEIYRYKAKLLRTVRSRRPVPYLRTLLGRKRRLPDLLSRVPAQRSKAERQVVNSHIQGSQADMTKLAMARLHKGLLPGMQILLTVHDEIAALCPADIAEEGAAILQNAMAGEEMQLLSVPVTTEVKICKRWSEAK